MISDAYMGQTMDVSWKDKEWNRSTISFDHLEELPADLQMLICNAKAALGGQSIQLASSGTSGSRKQMTHVYNGSVTEKLKRSSTWVSFFRPDTFSALDVAIQAFRRSMTLMNAFGQTHDFSRLPLKGEDNFISCTPSLLRYLMTTKVQPCFYFSRVYLGGELVSPADFERARTLFPKATITQIYALTEIGSLMASQEPTFQLQSLHGQTLEVDEQGELCVIEDDRKLRTGDLFAEVSPGRWSFYGRKDRCFKVAGHLVNPEKIEILCEAFPGVISANVQAVDSSLVGSLIRANLTIEKEMADFEERLLSYLSERLEKFEIPQFFEFHREFVNKESGKKLLHW